MFEPKSDTKYERVDNVNNTWKNLNNQGYGTGSCLWVCAMSQHQLVGKVLKNVGKLSIQSRKPWLLTCREHFYICSPQVLDLLTKFSKDIRHHNRI